MDQVKALDEVSAGPVLLDGGGEVGALIRAHDWARSPLGPPDTWPQSLKTVVRIMLTSRYAMWMGWGEDLTFFYNDAYARETLGKKHPWALGRPAREVWAEIWDDIGPRVDRVLKAGEATWDEELLLFLERSGYREETYHTFSYSPLQADDGAVAGLLCVVTEATERVIAGRRLATLGELSARMAEARSLEEVFGSATAVLAANRRDLPFVDVYLADRARTRLELAVVTGLPAGSIEAPATIALDGDSSPMRRVVRHGHAEHIPSLSAIDLTLPAGEWGTAPHEGVVLPMLAPSGEAMGAVGIALNPFRPYDEAYRSFVEMVAGQIGAAVNKAQAQDEERRRAEALAELDAAKTTFFSNVSHEFRTPLTLMLGPLEDLLATEGLSASARPLLETAHRNGLRLLKLVNNLLDFSRIEAGRMRARFEPTDLAALTAELASNFRSATDRAGLSLTIETAALPAPVHVDRDMWEKIILNLLSNAFKFTFEGGISVRVQPTVGGRVEVAVRDSGVGIPAAELPHLFERFHRVQGAQGRSFEGSGIGLALVYELIRLHGGQIRVESAPGAGSTFTVSLPIGAEHLPADQIEAGGTTSPTPARAQTYVEEALRWLPAGRDEGPLTSQGAGAALDLPATAHGRVLIADDNADMRDYLVRLLRAQRYEVVAAADGEAALDAAAAEPPDLILADVMMPRLDGFGLLSAIRARPGLKETPVILLSARAGEEARVEGLQAGADDYLTKPFSARDLLARVAGNIQLARMRRELRDAALEETRTLEVMNVAGRTVAAELDLARAVQAVVDAATELSGAAFGAFFYNVLGDVGESYTLYALSGAPRSAFEKFPMPRNTQVFAPTFKGEGVVRSADITADPRYGRNRPHRGQPKGHLPVRSYLAAPVVSRSGEVLGGLFFGHPQPGVFDDRAERIATGIAAQAAIAIDNARLFQAAQNEIARRAEIEGQLDQKVQERTAELAAANRELLRQIEERERVEETLRQMQRLEAVGQLTSGVAHDFNNLLTVVLGGVDFLERGIKDPAQQRPLTLVREAAERGAKLTAQLLAFSRRQRLEPKALNLNTTIEGMRDLLQSTLGGAMTLRIGLADDLWPALVDPTQIELMILNLAINARDAMQVGGELAIETRNVRIRRKARRAEDPDPGDYVAISVCDTGTGMTRAVRARVFEPFFTTKGAGKGSGLGLAQVYGFAKQSGGGVGIETRVGKGTCVRVYLPRTRSLAAATPPSAPAGAMAQGLRRTILLVDDDNAVREVEAAALHRLGYQVIAAGSGGAALELLEAHPEVDALVLDFAMPGMNGADVARKAARLRADLPVLFITGYGDLEFLGDVGEGRVIQKPFHPEEMARKLEALFEAATAPA